MSARRLEAEGLELGGGLEVLLAAALEGMPAGERIEVIVESRSTALELPSWARAAGHETVAERKLPDGGFGVELERGPFARVHADALPMARPHRPCVAGSFTRPTFGRRRRSPRRRRPPPGSPRWER